METYERTEICHDWRDKDDIAGRAQGYTKKCLSRMLQGLHESSYDKLSEKKESVLGQERNVSFPKIITINPRSQKASSYRTTTIKNELMYLLPTLVYLIITLVLLFLSYE